MQYCPPGFKQWIWQLNLLRVLDIESEGGNPGDPFLNLFAPAVGPPAVGLTGCMHPYQKLPTIITSVDVSIPLYFNLSIPSLEAVRDGACVLPKAFLQIGTWKTDSLASVALNRVGSHCWYIQLGRTK